MVLTNDNPLRSGFEIFYNITNAFVDTLIYPSISKDYIENRNKTMDYVKNIDNKFLRNNFANLKENWRELVSVVNPKFLIFISINRFTDIVFIFKPFNVYPNLVIFMISTILLALGIFLTGFFVFSYRCCCKPKANPFDRKLDSKKRKMVAFVQFILLVFCL